MFLQSIDVDSVLDVDSLFTNIPFDETIENTEKVDGLSKIEFKELLFLATKEFRSDTG